MSSWALILFGLHRAWFRSGHDNNWECAGWMSEWMNVTSSLAGSENSLPKEYFNGVSSAATLTMPLSIPLTFHRLYNNLSPGLNRPITLARLLLAGTAPGSKGPLEPSLQSQTWTEHERAMGFYIHLFITVHSLLAECKRISRWSVHFKNRYEFKNLFSIYDSKLCCSKK